MCQFLKRREVAKLLQISERTVFTLTQEGRLPAVRMGKKSIRYREADIQRFAEASLTTTK